MDPRTWGPAEWEAFGTVGGLAVGSVVAVFAAVQVLQARTQREEQARPFVIVDFDFKGGWFVNLAITNIGTTAAKDVEFTFDKPLRVPNQRDDDDFDIFKAPIPMMAPGRNIRVRFGSAPDFFKPDVDVPLKYVVHAKYTDLTGKKTYNDPPVYLDLLPYKNTLGTADHAADVAQHLKSIDKHMKTWTSNNGLKVRATDQRKVDRREARSMRRRRGKRVRAEQGSLGLIKWKWQNWKHRRALR